LNLLFLLTASPLLAQKLYKDGRYWVGEIEKTFTVENEGTLIMEDIRGDVTIETWNSPQVKIHEYKKMDIFQKGEAESALKESEQGYKQDGNTVFVSGPGFSRNWIHSEFSIQVPNGFSCRIETRGGDIEIYGAGGNVDVKTSGGDIEIENIGGSIRAVTGGGDIEILNSGGDTYLTTGGGDVEVVRIEGNCTIQTGGGDITAENTFSGLSISTGGGDVEVEGAGSDVHITTGGGEISIMDTEGNVKISTGGGEIDAIRVTGNFSATTGGGSIDVENIEGKVTLSTAGGDVCLENIQGGINVSTAGGDVYAELTLENYKKDYATKIITGGGDIELSIPGDLPATIKAQIRQRNRRWEDFKINSDFPLKITTSEETRRYSTVTATGEINGGGPVIHLKAQGGSITISRQ
jgi:DUF4097 and DUF4098 domain-containing protein YvlB